MGLSVFDERAPMLGKYDLLPADGTNNVVIHAVHATAARLDALIISNNDTIAHVISVSLRSGAAYYTVGTVSVPAGAGFAATLPVDAMATLAPASLGGLYIPPGFEVTVAAVVAVVATHYMYIVGMGGFL